MNYDIGFRHVRVMLKIWNEFKDDASYSKQYKIILC